MKFPEKFMYKFPQKDFFIHAIKVIPDRISGENHAETSNGLPEKFIKGMSERIF